MKSKLAETAQQAASKVKEAASSTFARAKEESELLAEKSKRSTAGRLGGYSQAIHDSARALEEKDPNIAWFTHRAADKLQNVADYMRSRDLSDLRHDAEGLARRHPALFYGGMFLTGLILGNVVTASRRKLDRKSEDERYEEASERMAAGASPADSGPAVTRLSASEI